MSVEMLSRLKAAQEGDNGICEQLLEENAGLVWSIVRRYLGRGTDPDDLYQLGCLGFLKAIKGFDPSLGYQFSTYAVPKISGEIRRFIRDDGTVKVSRGLREQGGALHKCKDMLQTKLGREPTLSELSDELGISPEDIAAIESANTPVASLQSELSDGLTLEQTLGDGGLEEQTLEIIALRAAIAELSEREKQVIRLRYFRSLTQEQTAKILSVSQVQVSRLERKAIERLREKLHD